MRYQLLAATAVSALALCLFTPGQARAASYTFTTINNPLATGMTYAFGINDSGQVTGYYNNATGTHGFVDTNGTFTTINDPLATGGTLAYGINDNGQVTGD